MEVSDIADKAASVEDQGADSLDRVKLIMALEETFDLEIPDESAENIATVHNAVDYIEKNAKSVKQ